MYTQIITIPMDKVSKDERQVLCNECAAICYHLAGVRATQWHVNHATNTVSGMVKWTEYEMIAQGTETLCTQVASLCDADRILRCREIACSAGRRRILHDSNPKPNTGFVQHPPDYDPRG